MLALKTYHHHYDILKFVHFKVILNKKSCYLLYELAENYIIKNEFKSYSSYTHITWMGTVYSFLLPDLRFIKRKLPHRITWVAIEFIP